MRSGAFCTEQRKMKFVFLFLPLGIQPVYPAMQIKFYKNLDFWDGMTSDVMLMSIIKIEGVICE